MSSAWFWVAVLVALPVLVIGASYIRLDVDRLRRLAVASAAAMLLAALVVSVSSSLRAFSIRTSALTWAPGGEAVAWPCASQAGAGEGAFAGFFGGAAVFTCWFAGSRRSDGVPAGDRRAIA